MEVTLKYGKLILVLDVHEAKLSASGKLTLWQEHTACASLA